MRQSKSQPAYYNTIYQNGQFINTKTGKEIKLKDGAKVRFQTDYSSVLDEDYDIHAEKKEAKIIEAREQLTFKIASIQFIIELNEPLSLTKEGNSFSRLSAVSCVVTCYQRTIGDQLFEPIEVESLSQAYFQTSKKYFPKQGSHNRNMFDVIRWKNQRLKEYRIF